MDRSNRSLNDIMVFMKVTSKNNIWTKQGSKKGTTVTF